MNTNKLFLGSDTVAFVLCGAFLVALTGCTTYVEQPRPREVYIPPPAPYVPPPVAYVPPPAVYVAPPVVEVEAAYVGIRSESDFYEPLTPYGRWAVVGSHGRCWIPGRVDRDWRPYSNGYWQRTDAGWYWASDEPWGWATYHYGRWDVSAEFGWFWVPQTQWAPAWVSWHQGGGYMGWAPLQPAVRIGASGVVAVNVGLITPRAFVFVEERRFLEPVRPTTVVVNNTTIINKTVNITNIKVVNNTVINEGPRTTVIEQVSGKKVQAVPVRELRRKQEAEVVARQRTTTPTFDKKTQPAVRSVVAPRETKAIPAQESPSIQKPAVIAQEPPTTRPIEKPAVIAPEPATSPPIEKPAVIAHEPPISRPIAKPTVVAREPATPGPEKHQTKIERNQKVFSPGDAKPAEVKPVAKSDATPEVKRPSTIQEPTGQKAGKHLEQQAQRIEELKKKFQPQSPPRGQEKQDAIKRGGTNTVKKVQQKRVEEPQTPEKPAFPR